MALTSLPSRVQFAAALAVFALAASACGMSDGSGAGGGGAAGEMTIALADEPSTLDPQAALDGNERAVTDNVYETLLRRDPQSNELIPNLATELPTPIDDTTWEFKLREGVEFSNGEPFNAEAAAYSINRVIDPGYTTAQSDFFEGITGATAIDEYTLDVTTENNDPVLPARMYGLKMMPPKASEDSSIVDNPIGTGPYVMERYDRGRQIVLSRNDSYWGDEPSVKKVTIVFLPEAGSRASALKTGEVDLATVMPAEQTDSLPQTYSREGLEFPIFRLKDFDGPLADPRVRQALNYAVDKDAIAEELYGGYASVAKCQTLSPSQFGFNPDLAPYPYDPDKAKQLLAEAGYNGEPVTFLGPTGRWLKDAELNEAVTGYLEAVGLNIKSQIMPFSAYLDVLTLPRDSGKVVDIAMVSATNELYDASKISTYYESTGALSTYANDEVDAALHDAAATSDQDRREADFATATQVACEKDPALIYTVNLEDIYGGSDRLTWEPRLDGSLYIPEMTLSE
jgi:peptide/nickel transport system substrate-binding protein